MNDKDKYLIVVGVIICIVIGALSPFIASGDPDGLEKSAEDASVGEVDEVYSSPFPDYSFEPLGKLGEIGVLAIGTFITLIIGYGVAILIKRKD